jgi:hypothetical protein
VSLDDNNGIGPVESVNDQGLTPSDLKHAAKVTCGFAKDADEAIMFLDMLGLTEVL